MSEQGSPLTCVMRIFFRGVASVKNRPTLVDSLMSTVKLLACLLVGRKAHTFWDQKSFVLDAML